ncbi:G-type lectin S-receptor-like serine/threonine-protein kinase [Forsythia ovata]|uniref:G-type lectin S-receptor-like serine/threonine-protein kinase n=1 Tax=Forsythia ovata TaxID=205694 RepID=A0ABD1U6F8_9LAMI
MGWNLSTGVNRYLTSCKDDNDPSLGDITSRIDNPGMPQFVLRRGSEKIFQAGPWNGIRFSGTGVSSNKIFKSIFVYNSEDLYYMNEASDNSIITWQTVNQSGLVQRFVLNKGNSSWSTMYSSRNYPFVVLMESAKSAADQFVSAYTDLFLNLRENGMSFVGRLDV